MLTRRKTCLSFSVSALMLLGPSCAQTQKVATEANPSEVVSHTPPFQTKEPERYRAVRTLTTVTADGEKVTKDELARDGELRRDESELDGRRVVYLYLPEATFILLPQEKVFAEATNVAHGAPRDDSESSPDRLLHTEPISTTYQSLGAESVNGRSTQKYRVVVNSSPGANVSGNETVIWIDETLQMPIKSETKSTNGARSTMELSQIVLDVEPSLFRVPEGYEKISFTELRKRLQQE